MALVPVLAEGDVLTELGQAVREKTGLKLLLPGEDSPDAVSYTHLDVYKRQGPSRPTAAGSCRRRPEAPGLCFSTPIPPLSKYEACFT